MVLLFGRFALSQMDVPTRQAYLAALVDPDERTAAAAYTNTASTRRGRSGPVLAGVVQQMALGLPFFIGGGVKAVYDVAIWAWFRRVPIDQDEETPARADTTVGVTANKAHDSEGGSREMGHP